MWSPLSFTSQTRLRVIVVHEWVNLRKSGYGREGDLTDWFPRDQERGKYWEFMAMVRMCASGYGFAGRWITDPFSLPDGTPVTKVGLDHGVRLDW